MCISPDLLNKSIHQRIYSAVWAAQEGDNCLLLFLFTLENHIARVKTWKVASCRAAASTPSRRHVAETRNHRALWAEVNRCYCCSVTQVAADAKSDVPPPSRPSEWKPQSVRVRVIWYSTITVNMTVILMWYRWSEQHIPAGFSKLGLFGLYSPFNLLGCNLLH